MVFNYKYSIVINFRDIRIFQMLPKLNEMLLFNAIFKLSNFTNIQHKVQMWPYSNSKNVCSKSLQRNDVISYL